MPITLDGSLGITTPSYGGTDTSEYLVPVTAFKNRIINGAMMIDQRNAGASVTPTNAAYTLDRWQASLTQASKYTVQQNAGSVTPPAGYVNYLGITSSSAYTVLTGDVFAIGQQIEGFNIADLGWGTANASTVTLSFWVRSSLTGTFGGAIKNGVQNRSYAFTYTISSANTWEQKTVTIAGDTTGTWSTNNSSGFIITLGLGAGSTYSGSAGAWASANYFTATGATSVVGTNGATFYITGVQLEKGSTATSFDYRPYGTELSLCQRYYEVATVPTSTSLFVSYNYAAGAERFNYWQFKQTKRAAPTIALGTSASWVGATASSFSGVDAIQFYHPTTAFYISGTAGVVGITASAEL